MQVARLLVSRYVEHVPGRAKSRCFFLGVCVPLKRRSDVSVDMLVEQGGSKLGSSFGVFSFFEGTFVGVYLGKPKETDMCLLLFFSLCFFFGGWSHV